MTKGAQGQVQILNVGRLFVAPGSKAVRYGATIDIADGTITHVSDAGDVEAAGDGRNLLAMPALANAHDHGRGLHHVAFEVDDIVGLLGRMKDAGIRLIDESPRAGAHGTTVAFVHPASTGGVLVELVQAS